MAEWAGTAEARSREKTRAKSIAALLTWDGGLRKMWWRQVWRKNAKCNSPMPLAIRSRSVFASTHSVPTLSVKKQSSGPCLPRSASNRRISSNSLTFFTRFIPRPRLTDTSAKSTTPISRGRKQIKPPNFAKPPDKIMDTPTIERTETDYNVADISLADFGRKEISIAEKEMPGLMAIREKYAPQKPLADVRITGSLHMTTQTAVLIETLTDLGASVLWASCNIFSTQDHAAAAMAKRGVSVFAWKGESLEDYWRCTYRAISHPEGKGPQLVVDDGGDATLLIHKGYELEEGSDWTKMKSANKEEQVIKDLLLEIQRENPYRWHEIVKDWRGVSEETTTV